MRRVELYWWVTKVTNDVVLGITNYDKVDKVFYAIAEVDYKYPIDALVRRFEKCELKIAMLYETNKGYHIYTSFFDENPKRVLHRLYQTKIADRKHLSLAKHLHPDGRLVLRISKKYDKRDIVPLTVNEDLMTDWHREVYDLIEVFQRE